MPFCYDCEKEIAEGERTHEFRRKSNESLLGYKCAACYAKDPVWRFKCEIFSRVTGYLRPTSQWNRGKQAEFAARTPFKIVTNGL